MLLKIAFGLSVSVVLFQDVTTKIIRLQANSVEDNYVGETERIVNGKKAGQGMYPWMVALFFTDIYICSASIISPTTILTAAHCVVIDGDLQLPKFFHGIAGNVDKNSSEYKVEFSELKVHPGFSTDTLVNDIAILRTKRPLPIDDINIKPICIAKKGTHPLRYLFAIAMGWGDTDRNLQGKYPDILRFTKQKIVLNSVCAYAYEGMPIDDDKLCATGISSGICAGDSGGPLVHSVIFRLIPSVQIGVASYINGLKGCGRTLAPAVFTRVSQYNDFILKAANDTKICIF